jgi:DNA ligase D-like protein (predicted ligase)
MGTGTNDESYPARFIRPMECLPVKSLPDGFPWTFEIKLDGFRLQVVRNNGGTNLYLKRGGVCTTKYKSVAKSFDWLPDGTVIDGEITALDEEGRPDFNRLQNESVLNVNHVYYAFDLLVLKNRSLMRLPLTERRLTLKSIFQKNDHVDVCEAVAGAHEQLLEFVREHSLEGIVAKHGNSSYQPGRRNGFWRKLRLNIGQEFVIGGFIRSHLGFDSLILGLYEGRGEKLTYVGRVRAGFVPTSRRQVFDRLSPFICKESPFGNLPDPKMGRWGEGLTAEKMADCVWLKPMAVARVDFLEWTKANRLRHTSFVSLRTDKDPRKVRRET